MKLGSHVSFSKKNKYLLGAAEEAISYGSSAFMIYLGAPQNTRRTAKENMFLKEYEEKYSSIIPKENILVHAPYIINPSSVEKHQFAIDFLIKELEIMEYLGLKQIVLHPGAHTKFKKEDALSTLVHSLKEVLANTNNVEILIETMAGKGTEVGINLEEIISVIKEVGSERVGICGDTCHMWDAGYNIEDVDSLIEEMKQKDQLKYIRAWHINDSKNERGAGKDRHAQLGKGYINKDSLRELVNHEAFEGIIKVLETPWEDDKPPYKEEITFLKTGQE